MLIGLRTQLEFFEVSTERARSCTMVLIFKCLKVERYQNWIQQNQQIGVWSWRIDKKIVSSLVVPPEVQS